MSLRLRLVLLALAIAFPGLAASLWTIGRTYTDQRASLEQSLRSSTRVISLIVERELSRRDTIARMLAVSPFLEGAPELSATQLAGFEAEARRATEGLEGWVSLTKPDGSAPLLDTSRAAADTATKAASASTPADPSASRPEPQLSSGLAIDVATMNGLAMAVAPNGRLSASMQVPIRRADGVAMSVSLTVLPSELQRLIDGQALPEGAVVAIVDNQGRVVARHPDAARWVGHQASSDVRQRLSSGPSGVFETVTLDGVPSVAVFNRTASYGWAVAIAVPRESLIDSLGRPVVNASIGSLLLLLASIAAAIGVARQISGPIYSLQAAARSVERGEVVAAQDTGIRESDDVSKALAQASVTIARARVDLEERVAAAMALTHDAQKQLAQSQRLEALGQLTGGVAHDVNNLLAVIENSAYVLERRPQSADNRSQWSAIVRAIDAGRRLTGHLLRFARWNVVRPEVIGLATFLPSLAEILQTALGSMVQISMRIEPSTRNVSCDGSELELALINLAVNSRDAMPEGGEFIVVARNATREEALGLPDGDHVVIAVSDNGNGIAPEVRDRVFDPFFTTKAIGHGTGLGLSQIYGFCTQAGGTARILATSEAGTTMLMLLPASTLPVSANAEEPEIDRAAPPDRRKLLLVEDNDELGRATETMLTLFGYAVARAGSAEEAIELIDPGDRHFDVVLSDVVMPGGMNGISFARYLKVHVPDLPVILITGYAARLEDAHGFEVLRKPCAPEVLLSALRRVERDAAIAQAQAEAEASTTP